MRSVLGLRCILTTALALWVVARNLNDPCGSDGALLVQAADNFRLGRGLSHAVLYLGSFDRHVEPLKAWPPGFPLAVVAMAVFGWSVQDSTVILTHPSGLLVAPASVFCLVGLGISPLLAALLGALVALSPGSFAGNRRLFALLLKPAVVEGESDWAPSALRMMRTPVFDQDGMLIVEVSHE